MTYFNPKIYCKENLSESDKKDLDFYEQIFINVIENAKFEAEIPSEIEAFDNIRTEIIENFCRDLRVRLGFDLQELVVGIIDGYDHDVDEVENPTTYHYMED